MMSPHIDSSCRAIDMGAYHCIASRVFRKQVDAGDAGLFSRRISGSHALCHFAPKLICRHRRYSRASSTNVNILKNRFSLNDGQGIGNEPQTLDSCVIPHFLKPNAVLLFTAIKKEATAKSYWLLFCNIAFEDNICSADETLIVSNHGKIPYLHKLTQKLQCGSSN